jgi:hypothetical protein
MAGMMADDGGRHVFNFHFKVGFDNGVAVFKFSFATVELD